MMYTQVVACIQSSDENHHAIHIQYKQQGLQILRIYDHFIKQ